MQGPARPGGNTGEKNVEAKERLQGLWHLGLEFQGMSSVKTYQFVKSQLS